MSSAGKPRPFAKTRRRIPFEFVLDELERVEPRTRPMFGCTAVYVRDQIVLVLRKRCSPKRDDGVWIATTPAHHASLRGELPSLRSISMFGPAETGWQVLPESSTDFEESVVRACALIAARDPRIGKVPNRKSRVSRKTAQRAVRRRKSRNSAR